MKRFVHTHLLLENMRAFTLMELLVVMAIISFLLAISFPAIHRVKHIAKRINCAGNLYQIGTAWQLYLNDNEGNFYQGQGSYAYSDYGGWGGVNLLKTAQERPLNPYIGIGDNPTRDAAKVFNCPADLGGWPYIYDIPTFEYVGNSYSVNRFLVGYFQLASEIEIINDRIAQFYVKSLNISKVTNSHSLLPLAGDYPWYLIIVPGLKYGDDNDIRRYWHQRTKFNIVFLDGHVEFIEIRPGMYITEDYNVLPFKEAKLPVESF